MHLRNFILALGMIALPWGQCGAQSTTRVKLGDTTVIGASQNLAGTGVDFFGGLPFAKPPVGSLRFMPPVPVSTINASVFNATQFGPACTQQAITVTGPTSEDCLTLNVFRPAGTPTHADLPVAVWIYGGGFVQGQTSIYDATDLVVRSVVRDTPIVYVSMNYRLGPLGWPQGAEAAERGLLNLGLKDQLAALEWVQGNIRAFGGDPKKVTVFSESAGSTSIASHYLGSSLKKLVRGAIMESGFGSALPLFNASQREPAWDTFAANLPGCNGTVALGTSIPCAQNATTQEIISAWAAADTLIPNGLLFPPVIDGPGGLIPDLPSKLVSEGKIANIPFLAGTNLDEGTLFTPLDLNTTADLLNFVANWDQPFSDPLPAAYQADMQKILTLYPDDPALGSPFGTGNETFGAGAAYKRAAAIIGDIVFQAPARLWFESSAAEGVRAYKYLFTDQNAALQDPALGVTHSREVYYAYGIEAYNSTTPAVQLISTAMADYWLSFIANQTPNDGKGLLRTTWPQYTTTEQNVIQFDGTAFSSPWIANFTIIPDTFRAEQISFINSVAADLDM